MRKLNFDFDPKEVESFVSRVQKRLPEYKVNVNNVNDFDILLRDRECCRACRGLDECGNLNKGYYSAYEDDSFVLKECKYKKEDKLKNNKESLIKTLYLSKEILNARVEDYYLDCESRAKMFDRLGEFIYQYKQREHAKGLYIYGGFSIGKTYTLAAFANELAKNDIESLLIYFPDLVVDLKSAMLSSTDKARYEKLINLLKSVDVLMLDDVGSENMTPWLRDEVLGPVINYRVSEYKPVFISSNLNPKELVDHFSIDNNPANKLKGQRIMSRLTSLMNTSNMSDSPKRNR